MSRYLRFNAMQALLRRQIVPLAIASIIIYYKKLFVKPGISVQIELSDSARTTYGVLLISTATSARMPLTRSSTLMDPNQ